MNDVLGTRNEVLFGLKKEGNLVTYYNMDGPEDVMPSEISQSQKDKCCVIPFLTSTLESRRSSSDTRLRSQGPGQGSSNPGSDSRWKWG